MAAARPACSSPATSALRSSFALPTVTATTPKPLALCRSCWRQAPVRARSVPLRQLASFRLSEGLNEVSRDNGKRRIYVEANVRGRDLGSYVAAAQAAIDREVKLPSGSWLEWGGQFQNLQAAKQRLAVVIPICVALIFGILYMALGSAI